MDKQEQINNDRFYTPEGICFDMALRLNPRAGSRIFDPMCGDGRLLFQLRSMYPERDLTLVGKDNDREAIEKCNKRARMHDVFEVWDANEWINQTFTCNYIIMNPCFHSPLCEYAVNEAMKLFDKGIMYIPFDKFTINACVYSIFELNEYDEVYLTNQFDCEIKYRQGTIYWEKAK